MRRISVDQLNKTMVLAKPVYTDKGVVLMKERTELTDDYIKKIVNAKVRFVYVEDDLSEGIEIDSIISEEMKQDTKKVLNESFSMMREGYFNTGSAIDEKVEKIVAEVMENPRVMVSLQEIRNKNDYLLLHSINVCVISLLLGKKMNYNDVQLKHLAFGALLHDIGKSKISADVTGYREDLMDQEFKVYKDHVRLGYEMIKAIPEASLLAANIALTHHEHYDGTGFPLGKKNTSIHEFSRIVAVANEYDNLLYNLPESMHMRHYEIVEMIVSRAYTWFDPDVVKVFRKSISPYPVSSGVLLSDGRIGIVSKLNENFPTRPIVRVIDEQSKAVIDEIDLAHNLNILIVDEKDIDK